MNLSFRKNPIDNGGYTVCGSCKCGGYYLQTNTFVKLLEIPLDLFDDNYGGSVSKCDRCDNLVFFPNKFPTKSWEEVEKLWYDAYPIDQIYYDRWKKIGENK